MTHALRATLVFLLSILPGCGASHTLSRNTAREKIQDLGLLQLKDEQVQVEKIEQRGEGQAIAEANLKMAFKLSKATGKWEIEAIRLGDRDWVEAKAFLSALNEVRARETRDHLQKLVEGLRKFKSKTGSYPEADNIVKLSDLLVPSYMTEVIRYDGWNRELLFSSASPDSVQLRSLGADGVRGTSDDIISSP